MELIDQSKIKGRSLASILNADSHDLSRLSKKGAKLLMYFGWGDSAITPLGGIQYYEQVATHAGGLEKMQKFFRLFMVPGMDHCGAGPGANAFGQLFGGQGPALHDNAKYNIKRALESWVEEGQAPDVIVATKYLADDSERGPAFTRPVCAYPRAPAYTGVGDPKNYDSFVCKSGDDVGK
jgi:feruloyl esterase